jgi:hypothetical protein
MKDDYGIEVKNKKLSYRKPILLVLICFPILLVSGESKGWAGWATAHPKIQPKLPNAFSISCHMHCNFAICLFVNAKQQESKSDLVFHVAICYHADS